MRGNKPVNELRRQPSHTVRAELFCKIAQGNGQSNLLSANAKLTEAAQQNMPQPNVCTLVSAIEVRITYSGPGVGAGQNILGRNGWHRHRSLTARSLAIHSLSARPRHASALRCAAAPHPANRRRSSSRIGRISPCNSVGRWCGARSCGTQRRYGRGTGRCADRSS